MKRKSWQHCFELFRACQSHVTIQTRPHVVRCWAARQNLKLLFVSNYNSEQSYSSKLEMEREELSVPQVRLLVFENNPNNLQWFYIVSISSDWQLLQPHLTWTAYGSFWLDELVCSSVCSRCSPEVTQWWSGCHSGGPGLPCWVLMLYPHEHDLRGPPIFPRMENSLHTPCLSLRPRLHVGGAID